MKKILVAILLCIIILTACNKAKPTMPAPTIPTAAVVIQKILPNTQKTQTSLPQAENNQEKTITSVELPTAPIESKIIVEKSKEFSPELRDLLQKADQEIKSITYMYEELPNNVGFDTYLIKDNKIKIQLLEPSDYVIDDYYNVVYIDTITKIAKGKCENKRRCISEQIDNTKRIYNLSYDQYRTKTPYEWIKEIDNAKIEGYETLNNHEVTRIKTQKNNAEIEMWVDTIFGLPYKIIVTNGTDEKTYYFKNMVFNTLKDSDVTIPQN